MELKETTKTQFGISQLEKNYNATIKSINEMVRDNNFILKVNGHEETQLNIHHYFDFNLSLNQRKKIAKKLYYFKKKNSLRNVNSLLSVLKRTGSITDSVRIEPSKKEQEIQRKRKVWLKLRNEAEVALKGYKEEKADFYKKRLIKLGY